MSGADAAAARAFVDGIVVADVAEVAAELAALCCGERAGLTGGPPVDHRRCGRSCRAGMPGGSHSSHNESSSQ